jgi:hypothetical protein
MNPLMTLEEAIVALENSNLRIILVGGESYRLLGYPNDENRCNFGSISRFGIYYLNKMWFFSIPQPGLYETIIKKSESLADIVDAVQQFYAMQDITIQIDHAVEDTITLLSRHSFSTEIYGAHPNITIDGTAIITNEKAIAPDFSIFWHACLWVGVIVKKRESTLLIKYSNKITDVTTEILNYYSINSNI